MGSEIQPGVVRVQEIEISRVTLIENFIPSVKKYTFRDF
jgi:hypothetical protein